jgi:hypothetical protein
VQDVDRPHHIERFPEPAGTRRPRGEAKALGVVTGAKRRDGILGHGRRRRHLGQRVSVGPPESQGAVGPAGDLEAFFVHRPMMPTAEKREI